MKEVDKFFCSETFTTALWCRKLMKKYFKQPTIQKKNISNNALFKTLSWIVSPFSVIFWRGLKETSRPSGPNLKLIISWELASTISLQCLYNIFTMSLQYLFRESWSPQYLYFLSTLVNDGSIYSKRKDWTVGDYSSRYQCSTYSKCMEFCQATSPSQHCVLQLQRRPGEATCLVVRVRIFVFFVFQLPLKPWHQGDLK